MAARYWIGTCYADSRPDSLSPPCVYLIGQQETCPSTGRLHWQLVAGFSRPVRIAQVKESVLPGHWEHTRSEAARAYVQKEDTRVPGSQFQLGSFPVRRNNTTDWDEVLGNAKNGNLGDIPSDIYIRYFMFNSSYYRSLCAISADHQQPIAQIKTINVYFGATGTGKSRRAWDEAGLDAYAKDPRTKWWDGYKGQNHIVIDEFRGAIDISHILRWFDRYPVRVEKKGGSYPLCATTIWITSNLSPDAWYSELDSETKQALQRRLTNIIEF